MFQRHYDESKYWHDTRQTHKFTVCLWFEPSATHLSLCDTNRSTNNISSFGIGWMAEPRTWTKFRQPTFKCNICSNSIHRTPRSTATHLQGYCEWFKQSFELLGSKAGEDIAVESWGVQISALSEIQLFTLPTFSRNKQFNKKHLSTIYLVFNSITQPSLSTFIAKCWAKHAKGVIRK